MDPGLSHHNSSIIGFLCPTQVAGLFSLLHKPAGSNMKSCTPCLRSYESLVSVWYSSQVLLSELEVS